MFEIKLVITTVNITIMNKIQTGGILMNKELTRGIIPISVAVIHLPRARVVPHNRIAGQVTPLEKPSLMLRMSQAIKIPIPISAGQIVPRAFKVTNTVGQIPTTIQHTTTTRKTIKAIISCHVHLVRSK